MLSSIARASRTGVRTLKIRPAAACFSTGSGPNTPHGGKLTPTMLTDQSEKDKVIASCNVTMELNDRQLCDVELICNGGFSPLEVPPSPPESTLMVDPATLGP